MSICGVGGGQRLSPVLPLLVRRPFYLLFELLDFIGPLVLDVAPFCLPWNRLGASTMTRPIIFMADAHKLVLEAVQKHLEPHLRYSGYRNRRVVLAGSRVSAQGRRMSD